MMTTLDQLRGLLAHPDEHELRSPAGKQRGYVVLHVGCTSKVNSGELSLGLRAPSTPYSAGASNEAPARCFTRHHRSHPTAGDDASLKSKRTAVPARASAGASRLSRTGRLSDIGGRRRLTWRTGAFTPPSAAVARSRRRVAPEVPLDDGPVLNGPATQPTVLGCERTRDGQIQVKRRSTSTAVSELTEGLDRASAQNCRGK